MVDFGPLNLLKLQYFYLEMRQGVGGGGGGVEPYGYVPVHVS